MWGIKSFHEIIYSEKVIFFLQVKKVSVTRANGKRKRTSALVVVGNGQGSIGKNFKFCANLYVTFIK